MKLISHRGNIDGKREHFENAPEYIMEAIQEGYEVEIDVWWEYGCWKTGHDTGQYVVKEDWLWNESFWIHCKNMPALEKMQKMKSLTYYPIPANYFWHDDDTCQLTSKGWIWAYPKVKVNSEKACAVLPELANWNLDDVREFGFGALCSDFVESYK